jgi:hypothetical protein
VQPSEALIRLQRLVQQTLLVLLLLQPLRLVLQTQKVMLMVQQIVWQKAQVLHHRYRCLMIVTKQ